MFTGKKYLMALITATYCSKIIHRGLSFSFILKVISRQACSANDRTRMHLVAESIPVPEKWVAVNASIALKISLYILTQFVTPRKLA
jgi:hypothetical protein